MTSRRVLPARSVVASAAAWVTLGCLVLRTALGLAAPAAGSPAAPAAGSSHALIWTPSAPVQVASAGHPFRGASIAGHGGDLLVAWAVRGGVWVRRLPDEARRLHAGGHEPQLFSLSDGYLALWLTMKGLKWHRKTELVQRLRRDGAPLGAPRSARVGPGGNWPDTQGVALGGDWLYLMSSYTYDAPSFRRVPLLGEGGAIPLDLDVPIPDDMHGAGVLGMASSPAGVQILWLAGELDAAGDQPALVWTTVAPGGEAHSRRVPLPDGCSADLRDAYWLGERWLLFVHVAGGPNREAETHGVGIGTSPRGRPVARRLGRLPLRPGRGLGVEGQLAWMQARGSGRRRVVELVWLGPDGRRSGPSLVLDPKAGPADVLSDVATVGALAVDGERLLALWPVHQGRHATLRATAVTRSSLPPAPAAPAAPVVAP